MPTHKKTLLLLLEDPHDREFAARWLEGQLDEFGVRSIADAVEFARALRDDEPAALVSAARLTWGDGVSILEAVRDAGFSCPVLLIGDESDHDHVVTAMRNGLADYIVKSSRGWLDLPGSVRRAVRQHEEIPRGADPDTAKRVKELEAANEALAQFAYIASHELREPLRVVEKHAELLASEAKDALAPQDMESLGFIQDGAHRMQAMILDMLEYYRVSAEEQSPALCDLNAVVRNVVDELRPGLDEAKGDVSFDELPSVYADAGQLRSVFRNLISNAIKFRSEKAPKIRVLAEKTGGEWVISVADNGIGIDADEADGIFEMFQRLHTTIPGTGIGLALCRRIVERHGGRIWVRSRRQQGSVFQFTLPATRGARSEERGNTKSATTAVKKP